jgi:D-alanine-D-alanine ligase
MRVVILHNAVSADASPADRDVLVQATAVSQALQRLGHEQARLAAALDLSALRAELVKLQPDVVFNLVESLEGSDWLMFLVTGLLDSLRIPYTGSPTESIVLSTHKLLAKELLSRAGLPTPAWIGDRSWRRVGILANSATGSPLGNSPEPDFRSGTRYVLKAISEHASIGLDDGGVVTAGGPAELESLLAEQAARLGCPCFAEEYIDGREFNLSLLASADGPEVLPPAEIDFDAFPSGKPRIVGYRAKWEEDSFEYRHTPRTFDIPASDRPLLDSLCGAARTCWDLFRLAGYGRVDFRVDRDGRPWILEVNANPCLSPDAGFAAALDRAGIPFDEAIERILHVPHS